MKRFLSILAALVGLAAITGCNDNQKEVDLKAPVLTATPANVVVPFAADDAVEVTKFTWTDASAEGAIVSYAVEFAKTSDSGFASPVSKAVTGSKAEYSLSLAELKSVASSLGTPEAEEYSLLARVKASAADCADVFSQAVTLNVKFAQNENYLTAPVLSSDRAEVLIDPKSSETAISLSWTDAAHGNLKASYKLYISLAEDMTGAIPVEVPEDYLYMDIAHYTLGVLTATMGVEGEVTAYGYVEASAEGVESVSSNVISVKLSQAAPLPEQLYIYFWAWNGPENAQPMEKVSDGVFTWTGDMDIWQFLFLNTLGEYWSGYMRDGSASEYWTLTPTCDPECLFMLNDQQMPKGNYTVTVDLNTLKVTAVKNETPLPEKLFVDTWDWGDGTQAKEMTALGDGKFTWTGELPLWNFKFTTSNASPDDYWTGYFRDPAASDYWTLKETSDQVMFSVGELNWQEGCYTINVDLNTLKVEMIPHIWMIGAVDWGWDRDNAEEMTYLGEGQFEWTGHLNTGNFKFLASKVNEYWVGYMRNESASEYWKAKIEFSDDSQFDVAHDGLGEGTYKVKLNINTKDVSVECLSGDSDVVLSFGAPAKGCIFHGVGSDIVFIDEDRSCNLYVYKADANGMYAQDGSERGQGWIVDGHAFETACIEPYTMCFRYGDTYQEFSFFDDYTAWQGAIIGPAGWSVMKNLFAYSNKTLFAVNPDNALCHYQYYKVDSYETTHWLLVYEGVLVDNTEDWSQYKLLCLGDNILGVDAAGQMYSWSITATPDAAGVLAVSLGEKKTLGDGWNQYDHLFEVQGSLMAVDANGDVHKLANPAL